MKRPFAELGMALAAGLALFAAGCHSPHVDIFIENRTGKPIQLLEVEYPSASFGVNALAQGAIYRYRIQVRGSGPLKVQYSTLEGRSIQGSGPLLTEGRAGQLRVGLLPAGEFRFDPTVPTNP